MYVVFIIGLAIGFGILGLLGIILMISGLTLSMVGNIGPGFFDIDTTGIVAAFLIVIIAFFLAVAGSIILSKQLFTTHAFGHLALDKVQYVKEGYTSALKSYEEMVGKTGVAYTVLRPAGKVIINEELFDATARSGMIEKGSEVTIFDYKNAQLIVEKT